MTPAELKTKGLAWLDANVAGWRTSPGRERRVQAARWLCDVVKPRELSGRNDGAVVEALLANVGLGKGAPWCAAAQAFVADVAGVWRPEHGAASVREWRFQAGKVGRRILVKGAIRGDLLTKDYGGGKGHIGIMIKRLGPWIFGIEGNTGSGDAGSQREGDGMYRRVRLARFWDDAIRGD